jgi:GNAT superfamily N-acetyltransferase
MVSKAYWGYSNEWMQVFEDDLRVLPEHFGLQFFFKCRTNGETAGYYSLWKPENQRIKMESLFVLPEWMGRGIGARLMAHALVEARKLGCTEMWLEADPYARDFYLRQGFQIFGQKQSVIPGRFLPLMKRAV